MNRKKIRSWEPNDDIISHLPDDILCHILSFMPTRDSVATCVLSKRWEHVSKYVTKLKLFLRYPHICELYDVTNYLTNSITRNIQSVELIIDGGIGISRFELPRSIFTCTTLESLTLEGHILLIVPSLVCLPKLRTLEFVEIDYQEDEGRGPDTLISSCSSSLESLLVQDTCFGLYDVGFFSYTPQLLCSALRHLELQTACSNITVKVPRDVFTCETLEKLSLRGSFVICDAQAISMPNLTSLALILFEYKDDETLNRLFESCTSLESLNVECFIEEELKISSCTLKDIELKLFCDLDDYKLVIDAPCLKYLKLNGIGRVDYHIANLASVEEADVRIFFEDGSINRDYCFSTLNSVYQALHNVKRLKVHHPFLKGCAFGVALPMFDRLTDLDVCMYNWRSYVLREFINNSIKLENLNLDALCVSTWMDPSTVPACLLTSLRSVSIRNCRGKDSETLMATYFLENAKILEKMEICIAFSIQSSGAVKENMCKEISNVCRGSEKCVVSFK